MNAVDAVDIDDFVYAATGARLRRLTLLDGSHWFPAVDVARQLGYASARQALRAHVADALHTTLAELPIDVMAPVDSGIAAHGPRAASGRASLKGLKKSTRLVCLEGLVQLVAASTKAQAAPFKAWVAQVVADVQRDGSYGLEPSPGAPSASGHSSAFVLPQPLLDALVRLEESTARFDDESERVELLRQAGRDLNRIAACLERLSLPAQRSAPYEPGPASPAPLTPQQLLDSWRARNAVVSEDVHAVAAYLAPALLRGGVRYRLDDVARRTGLTAERVRECVRVLVERGCMRQAGGTGPGGGKGSGSDGTGSGGTGSDGTGSGGGLLYVLP
ncbi:Bro-N domain-containing protein [Streptomyces sp. NPDC126499]|uniref:BRO-N domain-containing protein n=1 Tax=Streptomyces sp. NPDC126499 TaxID=3155314 RepID=UPI003318A9F0